jgi:hypothetical protein
MKKRALLLLGVIVLLAITVVPALAITNGQPDGDDHPYVGLMVALDEDYVPLWRCSGTLIGPELFLTAGHCTEAPAAHVVVWFDTGYPTPIPRGDLPAVPGTSCTGYTGYPCTGDASGTPNAHPEFCTGCGNGLPRFASHDVGVVVLDSAYIMGTYGQLPAVGVVDTLKNKTAIDFVGYGVNDQAQIPGNLLPQPPPYYRWVGLRTRMYAPTELVSGKFVHSDEFLRLALNPGGGSGGTCFGDSGGPDFLAGTNIILGVNSYVTNVNCSGVGYSTRVDTESNLDFINSYP